MSEKFSSLCSSLLGEGFANFPLSSPPLKYKVHAIISYFSQFVVTHEIALDDPKS